MTIEELKTTENKKCPFCNSDSKILDEHEKDCFLRLLTMGAIPPDVNIIKQYNHRPIEDALCEELKAWKNWAEMAFRYIRFGKIFKDDSSKDDDQRWVLIDTYNIEKERSEKKQSGEPHESN
jgi:glutaredoxin